VPFGSVISLPGGRAPLRVCLLLQVHLTPANAVPCFRALMPFPSRPSLPLRRVDVPVAKPRLQRISDERLGWYPTCSSFLGLPNLLCQRAVNPTSNRSWPSTSPAPGEPQAPKTLRSNPKPRSFEPPAFRPSRVGFAPKAPKSLRRSANSDRASSWLTFASPAFAQSLHSTREHCFVAERQQL
jgi:hypothetical protein